MIGSFCGDCGASLASRCPQCGAENPANKKFCGDCGASLIKTLPDAAGVGTTVGAAFQATGERRHLTVLFCDLVDSTSLAAHMDPENWRATISFARLLDRVYGFARFPSSDFESGKSLAESR